jgi:hypothetical protein
MWLIIQKLTKVSFLVILILIESHSIKHIIIPEPIIVISIWKEVISSTDSNPVNNSSSIPSSILIFCINSLSYRFISTLSLIYNTFKLTNIKVRSLPRSSCNRMLSHCVSRSRSIAIF